MRPTMWGVSYAALFSTDMSKSLLMAIVLFSFAGVSWPQPDPVRAELPNKAQPVKSEPDDPKQRRAAVRAALEAPRDQKSTNTNTNTNTETTPRALHQLSPQERQELRQQLRQQ